MWHPSLHFKKLQTGRTGMHRRELQLFSWLEVLWVFQLTYFPPSSARGLIIQSLQTSFLEEGGRGRQETLQPAKNQVKGSALMEPIWAPGREKSNRFGSYCRLSKTLPFYQSSWAVKYSGDIISITTWHQQWFSGMHGQAVETGVGEGASSSWSLALFAPTPSKHLPAQTSWLGCRVGAWETAHFLKPPEAGSYQLPVGSDHMETTYRQLGFKKLFSSEI